MYYTRKEFLEYLNLNKISFLEYSHKPLFTVEESKKLRGKIYGGHTKNLFLKDKKKNFFLLSTMEDKKIDLKKLKLVFETNSISFASDFHLKEILGLDPGSVSPYGLINDNNKVTKFYLDKDILNENTVNFHPLTNSFTISLTVNNFVNFINKINVKLHLINLEVYRLINNGKY